MICGQDGANDFFVTTHGVTTPDFWWKLLYRHDTKAFAAWILPNDKTAKASRLDDFLVTINELKARVDFAPDFEEIEESPAQKPKISWAFTSNRTLKCEGISTSDG